jgi:hypothetical protein
MAGDGDREIREKLQAKLGQLAAGLPPHDQAAVTIALGSSTGSQLPFLGERETVLADQLERSKRTARRRMERAFQLLAEYAVARWADLIDTDESDPERGWHVQKLEALLRLDTTQPEVTEARTIVSQRPDLRRIATRFSLPAGPDSAGLSRDVHADVAQGATIESVERLADGHFLVTLTLPRPIGHGQEHRYTIIFTPAAPIRPYYALVPLVRVDQFQLRVRFDSRRRPEAVWRLEELAPRVLGGSGRPGEFLQLDDANEVMQEFAGMRPGFGYGIAWRMSDDQLAV